MGTDAADDAERHKARVAALYDRVADRYDEIDPAAFARFGERVVEVAGIGRSAGAGRRDRPRRKPVSGCGTSRPDRRCGGD